jgi:hypothetical protein
MEKKLKLDESYYIDFSGNTATLVFTETRVKKNKHTGQYENYTFTDNYYFLNFDHAFNKYLNLKVSVCKDILEVLTKLEEINNILKSIKNER